MEFFHRLRESDIDLAGAITEHSADESAIYKEVDGEPIYIGYFLPEDFDRKKKYPTLLLIHGGGWSEQKIFEDQNHWMGDYLGFLARYYAKQGFVSISIAYRLAREQGQVAGYELLDCYEDCCDAIDYVIAHADEYGIDVKKIYLLGESAGGHLAGAVATFHYDRTYAFRKVFLVNAITDMSDATWNKCVPLKSRHAKLACFNMEEKAKLLSPLYQINPQVSEVVLIHGEKDHVVLPEHSRRFYERMCQASKICDIHWLERTDHAFLLAEYVKDRTACKIGIEIINQYLKERP